jgi:hypothetical protein
VTCRGTYSQDERSRDVEVLAGFVLGYLLGSESGAQGVAVMKDAIGSVAGSGEIQSVFSGGMSGAQGLLGGLLGGGGSVKDAISEMASSDEIKGILGAGLSTAQGLAFDLFGRGKEMVSQQRSRGLRLVI